MKNELIAVSAYCTLHGVGEEFLNSLQSVGLIEIRIEEDSKFVEEEQLHELELYTRLYHELGINPEGIDAISHLLHKIRQMDNELNALRNRLRFYEE